MGSKVKKFKEYDYEDVNRKRKIKKGKSHKGRVSNNDDFSAYPEYEFVSGENHSNANTDQDDD